MDKTTLDLHSKNIRNTINSAVWRMTCSGSLQLCSCLRILEGTREKTPFKAPPGGRAPGFGAPNSPGLRLTGALNGFHFALARGVAALHLAPRRRKVMTGWSAEGLL